MVNADPPLYITTTSDRIVRRARNLARAISAYPSASPDTRTVLDSVALTVTPEEFAEIKADKYLWEQGDRLASFYAPMCGERVEMRLCGILILPR